MSSSPARGSFLQIDKPKMCEGASSMQIDEHKKLRRSGHTLCAIQTKARTGGGGGRGDICDHGLFGTSPRIQRLTSCAGK